MLAWDLASGKALDRTLCYWQKMVWLPLPHKPHSKPQLSSKQQIRVGPAVQPQLVT